MRASGILNREDERGGRKGSAKNFKRKCLWRALLPPPPSSLSRAWDEIRKGRETLRRNRVKRREIASLKPPSRTPRSALRSPHITSARNFIDIIGEIDDRTFSQA